MFRFKIALQFLTRFPVQLSRMPTDQEIANSLVWYSVIGVLIGGLMAITGYLLAALPGYITAALVLTMWIVLTGALHLDGFADTVDAWVGGYGVRERTLELMKDPNCGPMAVVGVFLLLLLKYVCLIYLLERQAYQWLILVPWIARLMVALLFVSTNYIRPQGLGAALASFQLTIKRVLFFALQFLLMAWFLGPTTLGITLVGLAVLFAWRTAMVKALGGITGDVVGAQIEITEVAALFFLVISCVM